MKSLPTILVAGALTACAVTWTAIPLRNPIPSAVAASDEFPESISCRVVSIIDGDTFKCVGVGLDLPGDTQTCLDEYRKKIAQCWNIRIARIDTGETTYEDPKAQTRPRWLCDAEHESGLKAKRLTGVLIAASGNVVRLTNITDDYYAGRRGAEVWGAGGFNFSDELLALDLAVPYDKRMTKAKRKALFCPQMATEAFNEAGTDPRQ